MPLFNLYRLQTAGRQQASVGFRDGSVLHINERTDAVLRSPHLTYVTSGEVYEIIKPGTDHRVQTATAVAAAIGTRFDVRNQKRRHRSVFIVLEGTLQVRNKLGAVLVKKNQETIVENQKAPQPPQPVNARAAIGWAANIPTPRIDGNAALDASGGQVEMYSSQTLGSQDTAMGAADAINDGRLDTGWEAAGAQNQSVTMGFQGLATYAVSRVVIDPAATGGASDATDLKTFDVQVSTTGLAGRDFSTVFSGVCQRQNTLQQFALPTNTTARFIRLIARDNYGDGHHISVAEFEVVGHAMAGLVNANLITNGNAEAGPGAVDDTQVTPLTGWSVSGNLTAVQYETAGLLSLSDHVPLDHGANFFAGGPNSAVSSATQTIDVSSKSSAIDAAKTAFLLTGYLGGFSTQDDHAVLTATFRDGNGSSLGAATIGPVTAQDRDAVSGIFVRSTSGAVPIGTRSIQVTLTMTRRQGSYNDGYADDLGLYLFAGS